MDHNAVNISIWCILPHFSDFRSCASKTRLIEYIHRNIFKRNKLGQWMDHNALKTSIWFTLSYFSFFHVMFMRKPIYRNHFKGTRLNPWMDQMPWRSQFDLFFPISVISMSCAQENPFCRKDSPKSLQNK